VNFEVRSDANEAENLREHTGCESGAGFRPDATGQPESGGIVLAVICWAASAQRRCYPTGRCNDGPSITC
jgi:hypothetical protein